MSTAGLLLSQLRLAALFVNTPTGNSHCVLSSTFQIQVSMYTGHEPNIPPAKYAIFLAHLNGHFTYYRRRCNACGGRVALIPAENVGALSCLFHQDGDSISACFAKERDCKLFLCDRMEVAEVHHDSVSPPEADALTAALDEERKQKEQVQATLNEVQATLNECLKQKEKMVSALDEE